MTHRARRCIVHIGLAKTGTTTIQRFLRQNRDDLLTGYGIYYPGDGENHFHFQTAFSETPENLIQVRREGITDRDSASRRGAELLMAFEKDLDEHRPETVLISSEYFSAMRPQELRRFGDYLRGFCDELSILAYVRDPWGLAASTTQQKFKDGILSGRVAFRYTGYLRLLRKFRENMCKQMSARPFIAHGSERTDVLDDICGELGIDREGLRTPGDDANISVGLDTTCLLSVLNAIDPCLDEDGRYIPDVLRDVYRNELIANSVDRTRIRLSPTAVARISGGAKGDLEWLGQQFPQIADRFESLAKAMGDESGVDEISIEQGDMESMLRVVIATMRSLSAQILNERGNASRQLARKTGCRRLLGRLFGRWITEGGSHR